MKYASILCLFAGSLLYGTGDAFALSAPTLKPPPALSSIHADSYEFDILVKGLRAADAGEWNDVRKLQSTAKDELIKKILLWKLAGSAEAHFVELVSALTQLHSWPGMSMAHYRAEKIIADTSLPVNAKINWLTTAGPRTGPGKLALAQLAANTMPRQERTALIRDAWRNDALPLSVVQTILSKSGTGLRAADHQARIDMLLWQGKRRQARLLLPKLGRSDRRVAEARLALMERRRGVDRYIVRVPKRRASDPGLLYERARWRRRKNRHNGAVPLLLAVKSAETLQIARPKIWNEREIAIRRLIRDKKFSTAYKLATNHAMSSGIYFAEAEWTSGWLALRYLHDAPAAVRHFRKLSAGVGTPISKARAEYWLGRALESMDQHEQANAAYARAALWPFTFYGQLAAERKAANGGQTARLHLPSYQPPSRTARNEFFRREPVRAAILLADAGRRNDFERFSMHIDDRLNTPEEHMLLYELAQSYLHPRAALRSAKTGLSRGMMAPNAAWPELSLPAAKQANLVEAALILALSRQESEFNPHAISHAGAIGMMQLMPQTARIAARKAGMSYSPSWLLDEPDYNIMLGWTHLNDLVERFDGSYIMALAAYNAGARRPDQWIREYGDPRSDPIDAVDWIESIPFAETRNYVQRVLESLQVYRYQLQGEPVPIQLSQDLKRGSGRE